MLKLTVLTLAGTLALATLAPSSASAYDDYGVDGAYVGAQVQVYSGGGWSPATVISVDGPSYLVRYAEPGWQDEWVDGSQLSVGSAPVVYQPAIQVYYGSTWYDGVYLGHRHGRHHVRYRGVDEWISSDRLQHRGGRAYHAPRATHDYRHGWDRGGHRGHGHKWHGNGRKHGGRDHDRGNRGRGGHRGGGRHGR